MKYGFLKGHKVAECQDTQGQLMARFLREGVVDQWRDNEQTEPEPPTPIADPPAPTEPSAPIADPPAPSGQHDHAPHASTLGFNEGKSNDKKSGKRIN